MVFITTIFALMIIGAIIVGLIYLLMHWLFWVWIILILIGTVLYIVLREQKPMQTVDGKEQSMRLEFGPKWYEFTIILLIAVAPLLLVLLLFALFCTLMFELVVDAIDFVRGKKNH